MNGTCMIGAMREDRAVRGNMGVPLEILDIQDPHKETLIQN